jgi:hypothetical protein
MNIRGKDDPYFKIREIPECRFQSAECRSVSDPEKIVNLQSPICDLKSK